MRPGVPESIVSASIAPHVVPTTCLVLQDACEIHANEYVTTCIQTNNFHTKLVEAEMPKGAD